MNTNSSKADKINELIELIKQVQILSKELWGTEYLDCDCGHSTELCKCDCYMCEKGWQLTEMYEIHRWEEKLLPLITSRFPDVTPLIEERLK